MNYVFARTTTQLVAICLVGWSLQARADEKAVTDATSSDSSIQMEDATEKPPKTSGVETKAAASTKETTEKNRFAWLEGLSVGARITVYHLTDNTRSQKHTFLGSVDKIEDTQDYSLKPYATYQFCPYFGIGVQYEQVKAKTITQSDSHTDGTIDLRGPIVSLLGYYPNSSRYTPYGELGVAFYKADFIEDDAWAEIGNHRRMRFDDTTGLVIGAGCLYHIKGNWDADFMLRYTYVSADDRYYLNGHPEENGKFPLNNVSAGIGIKYRL